MYITCGKYPKVSKSTCLKQVLKMTVDTETTMVNHWLGLCVMEVAHNKIAN